MDDIEVVVRNGEMIITVNEEIVYCGPAESSDPFEAALGEYSKRKRKEREASAKQSDPFIVKDRELRRKLKDIFEETGEIDPELADELMELEEKPY